MCQGETLPLEEATAILRKFYAGKAGSPASGAPTVVAHAVSAVLEAVMEGRAIPAAPGQRPRDCPECGGIRSIMVDMDQSDTCPLCVSVNGAKPAWPPDSQSVDK